MKNAGTGAGQLTQNDMTEGQRRQITVLFADIVGFTGIAERLGEEAAFEFVRDLTTRMTAIVVEERGTVQEFRGDGIMALFGTPIALEDATLRACRAALKLQGMIEVLGPQLEARHGLRPRLRIGIHAGPVILGEVDDKRLMRMTAIGDTVNIAARLQVEAGPGEVFISEITAAQVIGQVEMTDMGARAIRGKSLPQQVFRLDGMIASASRFDASVRQGLTSLVEREGELARLAEALARARGGQVEFVDVVGEAGIGKSRLIHEFRQRNDGDEVFILQGDCMADGASSAFLPFVDLVRSSFAITKADGAETTEAKLRAGLQQIRFDVENSVPYLMTLLGQKDASGLLDGLSADLIGNRMRQLLTDLLWHSCRRSPVVLIIEDLHWIDPGSEQLLQRIAEAGEAVPLLVVCAFRPYYKAPWAGRGNVTALPLGPISDAGTVRLLSEKLGVSDLGAELIRLAVEKIEGNPLYAEEIAKFLKARRGDETGHDMQAAGIVLPANLQNLIMERFDRLDPQTRAVLQAAAVAGRRFRTDLIASVMGPDVPAALCLHEAEQLEILNRVGGPDADYIFNHALVQDAVYATLMSGQRGSLHARTARALEERYAGRTEEIAETLAYHFAQTDSFDRAITYLAIAGRKNLQVFSLEVADDYFTRAVDLLDRHGLQMDGEFTAELLANWFEVLQWRAHFVRTIAICEPRVEWLESLSDTRAYAQMMALLGVSYAQQHSYDKGEVQLQKALRIGEARSDETAMAHALLGLMCIDCLRTRHGSHANVRRHYDWLMKSRFEKDELFFRTYAQFYMSWSLMIRGDLDPSLEMGVALIEMGRRESYPGAIGFGSTCAAYDSCFNEDFERSIGYAEDGVRLAGGIVDKLINLGMKGLALTLSGRSAEGLELLQEVRRTIDDLKYYSLNNIVDMPIGLALASVGELSKGMEWLEQAIAAQTRVGNMHGACVSHVVAGEIYAQMASGAQKPDARVLRRNALFLLRKLPFAKRHAHAHYDQAYALGCASEIHGVAAQAMLGKARLFRLSRQTEQRRAALVQARASLSQVRWGWLERQVAEEEART